MKLDHYVAIAILYQDEYFLLQLREDNPKIAYPGCWGVFGGHIEPGETPEMALERELLEEIDYMAPDMIKFDTYSESGIICHIFYGKLFLKIQDLTLKEGMDMALFTVEEIQKGERYSEKLKQIRPIGSPYRQVLLNFIKLFCL
jgi:8-oxo-dGTP pyrophosphatase MutT (NUDIX family)